MTLWQGLPVMSPPLGGPRSAAGGDPAHCHPHAQAGTALLLCTLAALQWQVSGTPSWLWEEPSPLAPPPDPPHALCRS